MRHPNLKGRIKLSLFTDDMVIYMENPNVSTKKLPGLIDEYMKLEGYKINIQKCVDNNETTNN